jgi:hypothetical protein
VDILHMEQSASFVEPWSVCRGEAHDHGRSAPKINMAKLSSSSSLTLVLPCSISFRTRRPLIYVILISPLLFGILLFMLKA